MSIKCRESLQRLRPYSPGKTIESVKKEYAVESVIKLASNENPLGPSPKAIKAIANFLDNIAIYPDSYSTNLKNTLAKKFNLSPNQILPTNGSDEMIDMIAKTFIEPNDEIIMADITSSRYFSTALMMNGKPIIIPLRDWMHDLEGMITAITPKTKIIWLCNPNNPTGTIFTKKALIDFLDQVPKDILVIYDEAYREFVSDKDYPKNSSKLLDKYENLMILRTFAKIYGLAGLRVGYTLANEPIIESLNKTRCPFNVNSLAQVAASAAINDDEFINNCYKLNLDGKKFLYKELDNLNIEYQKTETNHIWLNSTIDSQKAFVELQKQGIVIKPFSGNWIRVSIGTIENNKSFISSFKNLLK